MLRLAVAQIEICVGKPEENLSRSREALKLASDNSINILVLPELSNSGYMFDTKEEAKELSEEVPNGPFCEALSEWSEEGGLVVGGICEREGSHLYNSAAAFTKGKHLGTYRKMHLFDREPEWFQKGDAEPPVFRYDGYNLGVMICFDWVFPETARILALKGAHVILHPANLVLPYCQNSMVTRSLENHIFSATANRIGYERGLHFSGSSQIADPKGDILLRMTENETGIKWVDVDLSQADDKMISKRNHVLNDRRPELYSVLTKLT